MRQVGRKVNIEMVKLKSREQGSSQNLQRGEGGINGKLWKSAIIMIAEETELGIAV